MQVSQISVSSDVIDFGIGQPGFDLLPLPILRRAAEHRLAQGEPALLQYGLEQGDSYFRHALADFLAAGYGTAVSPDSLFITNGISQALDLLCTLFTQPGDVIFVEEPTYFLALRIFADHKLQVISLPTDDQGLIVEALEEKLAEVRPVFLYTIPAFQNPTSTTLSPERRERLVSLSKEHQFLVVADEVYQLLGFSAETTPPLANYTREQTIISLGSFSKILAPGLRLGWLQASPGLLEPLISSGLLESGGGLNPFTSSIVRSALEMGWQDDHLQRLQRVYKSRANALSQALRRQLAAWVDFAVPGGGFFIWLKLAQKVDTAELLAVARRFNVGFQPGVKFSARQGLNHYLRLSFAFYKEALLVEGVGRLQQALAAFVE